MADRCAKYRNPKFPVIYAALYPLLSEVAKSNGYGLAVHGSMICDFDLIAIPWTQDACEPEKLIDEIIKSLNGNFVHIVGDVGNKPHGRKVWTIYLDNHAYIDIGIMPLIAQSPESAKNEVNQK